MTSKASVLLVALAALLAESFTVSGQGVVTNIPPLPTLSIAEKERLTTPDPQATKKLQTMWQDEQAKYIGLTNGPIEGMIAALHQPAPGTTILWQHIPEVRTQEINAFRRGWLVWWPPRFDVDYGIMAKEPEATMNRAVKASVFEALLRRDETRAIDFLSGLRMDNPPTLQHACYAKAMLEYQPRSNLFTKATAPLWERLLDSENPLFLGMALQLASGFANRADLERALRRSVNSDWMSLKYLAVEAVVALPKGRERDELAHAIEPIRRITPLPALISDKLKEMEDAQPAGGAYVSPAAGDPSAHP
jgi:hypothetical protein